MYGMVRKRQYLTSTVSPASSEPWITAALKAAISVSTCGVWMAIVNTKVTLINI